MSEKNKNNDDVLVYTGGINNTEPVPYGTGYVNVAPTATAKRLRFDLPDAHSHSRLRLTSASPVKMHSLDSRHWGRRCGAHSEKQLRNAVVDVVAGKQLLPCHILGTTSAT